MVEEKQQRVRGAESSEHAHAYTGWLLHICHPSVPHHTSKLSLWFAYDAIRHVVQHHFLSSGGHRGVVTSQTYTNETSRSVSTDDTAAWLLSPPPESSAQYSATSLFQELFMRPHLDSCRYFLLYLLS